MHRNLIPVAFKQKVLQAAQSSLERLKIALVVDSMWILVDLSGLIIVDYRLYYPLDIDYSGL